MTIGYYPRFKEVCFPAINEVMPLSSGSLAKSANTDNHFLSTASVNVEAIKKYMDRVSIFSDVCGSEAEQDRFTDTVGAALVPVNAPPESLIICSGDEAPDAMFFVVSGEVVVRLPGGRQLKVLGRDANSRCPGGPTGPLRTPSRTPWILSG